MESRGFGSYRTGSAGFPTLPGDRIMAKRLLGRLSGGRRRRAVSALGLVAVAIAGAAWLWSEAEDGSLDLAYDRCSAEIARALGADGKLSDGVSVPRPAGLAFGQDDVYGWYLDLDVAGRARSGAYRCLFELENRKTPLFLAVIER